MLNLILASTRLYNAHFINLESCVLRQDFLVLTIILKNYPHRTRTETLKQLKKTSITSPALITELTRLVRKDSIENAELAIDLLNNHTNGYMLTEKIKRANEVYQDRTRRINNRTEFYENYQIQLDASHTLDRSKMQMLEQVRKQLKQPMLWGKN